MSYTANVPNSTQKANSTQPTIKANFVQVEQSFNLNHIALTAGVSSGKHKFVQMPEQLNKPAILADEGALYTKESSSSGAARTELFFEREDGTEIEVSGGLLNATDGWSFLPSGLLIKWGQRTSLAGGVQTITYPAGGTIPAFGTVFIANPFIRGTAAGDLNKFVTLNTFSNADISIYISPRTTTGAAGTVSTVQFYALGIV